jgi:signal recognition particle subunit SRP19
MTTSLSVFVGRSISLPCAATTASHVVDHTLNIVYKSLGTYGHLNLKDYDHVVLWLDYFNKNLKRRQGRKVNRERAVFDPTVQELTEAARAAGLQFSDQEVNSEARYPRRSYVKSGYVMVAKKEGMKKSQMIDAVAEKMLQKRNRQKSSKK